MTMSVCRRLLPIVSKARNSTSASLSNQVSADPEKESQTLTLSDGRTLGFAEYGSPGGKPLLYFHGTPSSRLEGGFHYLGLRHGARILSLDRPGFGLSTFQPHRRLLDWPSDVTEFAQKLGLNTYRILGCSGGGPHALACAKAIPRNQLKGVGILSGGAPPEAQEEEMSLLHRTARKLRSLRQDWINARFIKYVDPAAISLEKIANLSEAELGITPTKEVLRMQRKNLRESFRQGAQGYFEESQIFSTPWGFDLEDIDFKGVRLWCGDEDKQAPVSTARWMTSRIKGSILTEWEGYGHFTLQGAHMEQVFKSMMDD